MLSKIALCQFAIALILLEFALPIGSAAELTAELDEFESAQIRALLSAYWEAPFRAHNARTLFEYHAVGATNLSRDCSRYCMEMVATRSGQQIYKDIALETLGELMANAEAPDELLAAVKKMPFYNRRNDPPAEFVWRLVNVAPKEPAEFIFAVPFIKKLAATTRGRDYRKCSACYCMTGMGRFYGIILERPALTRGGIAARLEALVCEMPDVKLSVLASRRAFEPKAAAAQFEHRIWREFAGRVNFAADFAGQMAEADGVESMHAELARWIRANAAAAASPPHAHAYRIQLAYSIGDIFRGETPDGRTRDILCVTIVAAGRAAAAAAGERDKQIEFLF